MTDLYIALIWGAAAGALTYTQVGSRLGYGNPGKVWTIVGIVFVLGSVFSYTFVKLVLKIN